MNGKTVGAGIAAVALTGAVAFQNLADDCYRYTGLGPKGYVLVVECVSHGKRPMPPGIQIVGEAERVSWRVPKIEQFGPGEADGFDCACSIGTDCESLRRELDGDSAWAPAPKGITLAKDQWRGVGCFRKACVELWRDDVSSWPPECAQ